MELVIAEEDKRNGNPLVIGSPEVAQPDSKAVSWRQSILDRLKDLPEEGRPSFIDDQISEIEASKAEMEKERDDLTRNLAQAERIRDGKVKTVMDENYASGLGSAHEKTLKLKMIERDQSHQRDVIQRVNKMISWLHQNWLWLKARHRLVTKANKLAETHRRTTAALEALKTFGDRYAAMEDFLTDVVSPAIDAAHELDENWGQQATVLGYPPIFSVITGLSFFRPGALLTVPMDRIISVLRDQRSNGTNPFYREPGRTRNTQEGPWGAQFRESSTNKEFQTGAQHGFQGKLDKLVEQTLAL